MPKIIDHDERRDRLAAAAIQVIRRGGVDAATIRNIADESGWSRGVIEHYFGSRDELLAFCYRYALASAYPNLGSLHSIADPRERLIESVLAWLPNDENARLDNLLWLDFVGRMRNSELLRRTVADVNDQWISDIGSILDACEADRRYRVVHGASRTAELLSVIVDGVLIADAVYPDRGNRDEQEATIRMFIGALVVAA